MKLPEEFVRLEYPWGILRKPDPKDIESLYEIYSNPEVAQFDDFDPIDSLDEAQEIFQSMLHQFTEGEQIRWAMQLKGETEICGTCGLMDFDHHNRKCILGYDLKQSHWGRGIMTQCIGAVTEYAFKEMDIHRIEAYVTPGNIGSYRVLERNGYTREGHLRQMEFYKGEFQDGILYAKLSCDPS